ncbi:expressed protein [Phakopsora pachyrhizi]|uniref:Expressed protein n=1 Tax=Phakopsora pachyrhizi TaxID=170000 RepID=A0AAV0BFZ3_PHAPC|nr:expressed protein [Phakopsora pachyrhizi]
MYLSLIIAFVVFLNFFDSSCLLETCAYNKEQLLSFKDLPSKKECLKMVFVCLCVFSLKKNNLFLLLLLVIINLQS